MFIEDYQVTLENLRYYHIQEAISSFTITKALDSFLIGKEANKALFLYYMSDYKWTLKFGNNQECNLIFTLDSNILNINIIKLIQQPSLSVRKFLQNSIKELDFGYKGYSIKWDCSKKDAIALGIYKQLKSKQVDLDLQKTYDNTIQSAQTFVAKNLSRIDRHDWKDSINDFIDKNVNYIKDLDDPNIARFAKDLERRLKKLAKTHSKESISQFLKFLNSCSKTYLNYRK